MLGLERPRPAPKDVAIRDAKINIWRAPSLARFESHKESTLIRFVSQLATLQRKPYVYYTCGL